MHVTKWKQRRFPYNPLKPKVLQFGANKQPHKKDCDCTACFAYQRIICKLIGAKKLTERNNPPEVFFSPKSTPDHVVRRNRLHQTLSRFNFSN